MTMTDNHDMLRGGELPYMHTFPLPAEEHGRRAVVCIVHGMGEHGGRYGHVAEKLREAGCIVYAIDQRGHGRNPGIRGHADSVEQLAGDAAALLRSARARHPELPLFLYGHSMGGNVALSCALRCRPGIDGLILTSPWLRLAFTPPKAKLAVGRAIRAVWPTLTMSTSLKDGALYRDDGQRMRDRNDLLLHKRISSGLFFSIVDEGERSLAMASELDVPVLLLHGTADQVTSHAASCELAARLGERCMFVSREGGYHELHNDIGAQEVFSIITGWIEDISNRRDS